MKITDIIGNGKYFEPPFIRRIATNRKEQEVWDKKGNIVIIMQCCNETEAIMGDHICELLNREHNKYQSMCVRDRSNVCNLCHDCDVDVLNPGDTFAGD